MTDTRIDEAALDAKLKALEALEKTINQSYGEGAFMNMAEVSPQLTANAVPTGAISLDIALGIGGLPRAMRRLAAVAGGSHRAHRVDADLRRRSARLPALQRL